jgi:hypothetical protein
MPMRCARGAGSQSSSMPKANVDKLAAAAACAIKEAAALKLFKSEVAIAVDSTQAEFARCTETKQKHWKPVIVRAEIKPD